MEVLAKSARRKAAGPFAHFEISKLGELLAAVVELAGEWLDLLMNNLVGSNVAALGERLAADLAIVRPLPSVSPFVSLIFC